MGPWILKWTMVPLSIFLPKSPSPPHPIPRPENKTGQHFVKVTFSPPVPDSSSQAWVVMAPLAHVLVDSTLEIVQALPSQNMHNKLRSTLKSRFLEVLKGGGQKHSCLGFRV